MTAEDIRPIRSKLCRLSRGSPNTAAFIRSSSESVEVLEAVSDHASALPPEAPRRDVVTWVGWYDRRWSKAWFESKRGGARGSTNLPMRRSWATGPYLQLAERRYRSADYLPQRPELVGGRSAASSQLAATTLRRSASSISRIAVPPPSKAFKSGAYLHLPSVRPAQRSGRQAMISRRRHTGLGRKVERACQTGTIGSASGLLSSTLINHEKWQDQRACARRSA